MAEGPQPDEETKHRRHERIVGTITLIATLCAAGFAGGAYVQARRQADIAQAALVESDHPFLEFTATSNPDVSRGGKRYSSVNLTIQNQGTRAAVIHLAEFAIVEEDTVAAALDAISKAGLVILGQNCTRQISRKVLQPTTSFSFECVSVIPKRGPKDLHLQHLVGSVAYGGALGARWRQTFNMLEMTGGEWVSFGYTADLETRTDGRGHEVPTERYH
ncbi:hypothetical protein MKK67_15235 [Methylobacterium sp. J-072]|uniref:hypothetical protein n=1 Tax=Methylobacterium sp. J-072 TaxID=2836651 RepID=UPI001FB89B0E|nr:hypothetical protein [Methylobacterium sp. J-072]MCJ2093835.1 hypothetical protein [Methylobacterium sp. J-072]